MSPSRSRTVFITVLAASALLSHRTWAFDCADVAAKGVHFNLKELGGPYVVHWQEEELDKGMRYKYNFTVDICSTLKWRKGATQETECHSGSRVCAIRENFDLAGEKNSTITPIDIAGTYKMDNGRDIEARFELLKNLEGHTDSARKGIRAALHGGRFPFYDKKEGVEQRAIIDFVCDPKKTGLEDDEKDDSPQEDAPKSSQTTSNSASLDRRDDQSWKCEDSKASLRFCGYGIETAGKGQVKTLRLEWKTKQACEKTELEEAGMGFFGWFFIIAFLAIAAYLIFGSWLNYNRYGARGWDLLPHGDTIRDIPYIAKDFARKVMGTVQGGGSRGGYAAV